MSSGTVARHGRARKRRVVIAGVRIDAKASRGALASFHVARASPGVLELDAPEGAVEPRLVVRHSIPDATTVFVPHLAPEPGFVMADAILRAPAIVVADARRALAFVVDVDDLARVPTGTRAWIDYDHPRREITLACGAHRIDGHVLYRRADPIACSRRVRLRIHVLASEAPTDRSNPFGFVARFLWQRWGRALHLARSFAGDLARLEAMSSRVADWAFSHARWGPIVWQEVEGISTAPAGAPAFIVDVSQHPSVPPAERRWREARSIWNQAWFSTQRCANGLLRRARRLGSDELEARARKMTEVALAAPNRGGLFPSVLRAEGPEDRPWSALRWTNSDRRPSGVSADAIHLVDAAFTCRMLLDWHRLTGEDAALRRVTAFADRALTLERPSGAFPAWIEPDGRVAPELADSAESAVVVALLLDLGRRDARVLSALDHLAAIALDGRWEDFETYWSCAPWGLEHLGRRFARNGVYKQNTLAMFWTADAFLAAHRATGEARWLGLARRAADELSLYQAVWNPSFLPAPAVGGFGVMNADSEWNDARQSLFAQLFLDLADATGEPSYRERGEAALRASFSMIYAPENPALLRAYERRFPFFGEESYGFMMENQGHGAGDPIGTFTIFTWGNGSALAALEAYLARSSR
ncbi:MAG: hypothetical protein U0414_19090 [Polyangiaceae bacterium]